MWVATVKATVRAGTVQSLLTAKLQSHHRGQPNLYTHMKYPAPGVYKTWCISAMEETGIWNNPLPVKNHNQLKQKKKLSLQTIFLL